MTRQRPRYKRAFSLVEMLTVLVIMSILTALAFSFSTLRSTSISLAGNEMADVFAMARQNSISKSAYTAIVIKTQGTGACSAYCLLQLTRQDDGTFGSWTALTPWKYLAQGVVFENNQPSTDTFMTTSSSLPKSLPSNFNFQGGIIDLTAAGVGTVQCYQPDGTLEADPALTPGQALKLRVVEGVVSPLSGVLTYQGQTVSGNEVSYYDLVFVANTGVTKIVRP
jgi:prepilin-type N-terminal cleavage/methylation domain-containing protein